MKKMKTEEGKQLLKQFEEMKDNAELRALSKLSLERPLTEAQAKRYLELGHKLLGFAPARWSIEEVRGIVKKHQHAKVSGIDIDAVTANMLVTIHDHLGEENKKKFLHLELPVAIGIGWKILKKHEEAKH